MSVSSTGQYVMASTKYGSFGIQDTNSFLKYSSDFGITWNTILPDSRKRQYLATAITDDVCTANNGFSCTNTKLITMWVSRSNQYPYDVTSTSITTY